MQNIYLTGFMGTGKTAVGRELSLRLKAPFIDLDARIEEKESRTISDMFAKEGETYFRAREKAALQEVAGFNKQIIACGGGIVLDKENIGIMRQTGKIVCLQASADVILRRTKGFTHRPLLNVSDPRARIEALLQQRQPFYGQADLSIDTSSLTIDEVVQMVLPLAA